MNPTGRRALDTGHAALKQRIPAPASPPERQAYRWSATNSRQSPFPTGKDTYIPPDFWQAAQEYHPLT